MSRQHTDDLSDYALPSLEESIDLNLRVARRTNPRAQFVGVSLNTSKLTPGEAGVMIEHTAERLGLPCCDPIRTGTASIVNRLLET